MRCPWTAVRRADYSAGRPQRRRPRRHLPSFRHISSSHRPFSRSATPASRPSMQREGMRVRQSMPSQGRDHEQRHPCLPELPVALRDAASVPLCAGRVSASLRAAVRGHPPGRPPARAASGSTFSERQAMDTGSNLRANDLHPLRPATGAISRASRRSARGGAHREPRARARGLHRRHAGAGGGDERRPRQGTLLLKSAPDAAPVAAPLLLTDVRIDVSGMVARAHGGAALRQSDGAMARRRLRVSAAGRGRRRPPRHADRRAPDRRPDQGARARRAPPTSRRRAKAARRRWSSRSGRTCSRPASRTSGPTRRSSSRSNTRRRCATTTARSGCASRWSSRRATSPAPPAVAGEPGTGWAAQHRSACPTPSASRRRSRIRRKAQSIR